MNALPGWRRWLQAVIEPNNSPALDKLLEEHRQQLPVLWLMGKTGSGKSSIIQRLTGDTRAEVGNGFEPCTQSAVHYDHPDTAPVLRFLDTRGLGEAGYDPSEDLRMAQQGSHALLVLTRVDDPSQDTVVRALKDLKDKEEDLAIIHIHTALHTLASPDLERAIQYQSLQIEKALERKVNTVHIDFTELDDGFEDPDVGLTDLCEAIIAMVPQLARVLARNESESREEELFLSVRKEILGYSGASAAADILPAVGLVAVPSLQGKMLHALAGRYGLAWDKRMAGEFVAALGTSFLYRYLISLGTRQIAKFIPVYGQSAGAAAAASISFATTYALGRVACLYFYRRNHDKPVDPELLREAFINAFKEQRD
ncbi:MAG: YcjF family protein [Granulosicoccus sp.]